MVDEDKGSVSPAPSDRPRFWPLTITTAVAFAVLVSLGVWQLKRLAWKQGLIDEIEVRQTAEPVLLSELFKLQSDGEDIRYVRVDLRGEFLHDQERYYYAPDSNDGPGYEIFTPVKLADQAGLIVANRGFVPEPLKAPEKRSAGQVSGVQDLTGLIRLPGRKGFFTPDNNPQKNLWFWRDYDAMTAGLNASETGPKLGLYVDVEQEAPGGWPRGVTPKIELSNRHLGYAITWFGLALTLLVVYGVLLWGRRQK